MNKKIIKSLSEIFKNAREACLAEIKSCFCNTLKINYLLIKFFATMQKASNCALGAQQVATTMEAAQGVQAQKSSGAEQSAQLNLSNAALPKWTDVCGGTNRSTDLITSCSINMNEETKHISGAEKMQMRFKESLRAMRLDREKQSSQLNPEKVTVSQKQMNLCDGTDYRPIEVTNPITNNSNTMSEETICAQGAQQVATTSEASQSVQAQQSCGAEQPFQLNQSMEEVLYKYLCPTGEFEFRPVGITHCFDSNSKEYLGSFESQYLYKEYRVVDSEDDGYVFENSIWVKTDEGYKDFWFDVLDGDTARPNLLDSFHEIQNGYCSGSCEVVLNGIHVPVKYSTIDFDTFRNAVYETVRYGTFMSNELVEILGF